MWDCRMYQWRAIAQKTVHACDVSESVPCILGIFEDTFLLCGFIMMIIPSVGCWIYHFKGIPKNCLVLLLDIHTELEKKKKKIPV